MIGASYWARRIVRIICVSSIDPLSFPLVTFLKRFEELERIEGSGGLTG